MSEAIKTFQTLDSNSKISLIILKKPVVCFEKVHVYVYKASYCDKSKVKDSKKFRGSIIVWSQLP